MRKLLVMLFVLVGVSACAETPSEKPEKLLCDSPSKIEEGLHEKGYFHLLDMKNPNGVDEQLWAGGRDMVITVSKDDKICLASTGSDVVYNPVTLNKILEIYNKSQKEL